LTLAERDGPEPQPAPSALLPRRGAPVAPVRIDVDFSLAIHNRTGKYFIGRDVLDVLGDRTGRVFYGPMSLSHVPTGLFGRALGRVQLWQVLSQAGTKPWRLPRRRSEAPTLHLDPFTVLTAQLRRTDAVLCHDVGPLTNPDLFDEGIGDIYRAIYSEVAEIGPHLIFVSLASLQAFAKLFPDARPASTRVIYPTLRLEVRGGGKRPPGLGDGPFLLTVGSVGSRKNQARCIKAFERSGLAREGYRFVLCGGPEPGYEEVALAAREAGGVVLLSYVTDAELAWLYAHACGFVLTSLLEGFGIPVAEAIAADLVPLVSRDSVLEEVAGPGALTVDPIDINEVSAAMRQLCMMSSTEAVVRRAELAASIARFKPDTFAARWNDVFDHMMMPAERTGNDPAGRACDLEI